MQSSANSAGLYAVKLFVRGKPWIITIDDAYLAPPSKVPQLAKIDFSYPVKNFIYDVNKGTQDSIQTS